MILARLAVFSPERVCPRPSLPRPSQSLADPSDLGPAVTLPSISSNFTLSYAPSLSTCNSFRLVISRTDPTACRSAFDAIIPSNDTAVNDLVTGSIGPDSFMLTINGPERMVLERPSSYNEGACAYSFDVRLVAAGPVTLDVVWLTQVRKKLDWRFWSFVLMGRICRTMTGFGRRTHISSTAAPSTSLPRPPSSTFVRKHAPSTQNRRDFY